MASIKRKELDLEKINLAMRRAAKRARLIAWQTGTPLIIYENGKIVKRMIRRRPAV